MDIKTILLTVLPIAFGLVVKYHPSWKNDPNALIPYFSFAIALLTKKKWLEWGMFAAGGAGVAVGALALMHI